MKKMMIQITSGKGSAECYRGVAGVQSLIMKQAKQHGIELQVLENKAGQLNGTLLSTNRRQIRQGGGFLNKSQVLLKNLINNNTKTHVFRW
ncbi:hypothetical protein M2273_002982 [Mucilaginibacter lappiensis]